MRFLPIQLRFLVSALLLSMTLQILSTTIMFVFRTIKINFLQNTFRLDSQQMFIYIFLLLALNKRIKFRLLNNFLLLLLFLLDLLNLPLLTNFDFTPNNLRRISLRLQKQILNFVFLLILIPLFLNIIIISRLIIRLLLPLLLAIPLVIQRLINRQSRFLNNRRNGLQYLLMLDIMFLIRSNYMSYVRHSSLNIPRHDLNRSQMVNLRQFK